MITTINEYLGEIESQDTLKNAQKPKAPRDAETEAMAAFMKLNDGEKSDFLSKALKDIAGDYGAVDYAAKNRKSHSPGGGTTSAGDIEMKKLKKEELDQLLRELFPELPDLTAELHEKFRDFFWKSVGQASLREGIIALMQENPQFKLLFADESQMDICRLMMDYIETLEEDITTVESENLTLARQIVEKQSLTEETLFAPSSKPKRQRRSLDMDGYVSEDNAALMESQQEETIKDPAMRTRVRYLERTAGAVDQHGDADNILQTWKLQN